MSDPVPPPAKRTWLIVGGVVFMLVWIAGHVLWASLCLMGSLMANDSGRASPEAPASMIFGLLGGQILAGAAGIPAGLAFFWRERRGVLLSLFAMGFVGGAVWQWLAFRAFVDSVAAS